MKPLPARVVAKILLANGFVLARQRGSHQIYKNPKTGAMVPVPWHGGSKPIQLVLF